MTSKNIRAVFFLATSKLSFCLICLTLILCGIISCYQYDEPIYYDEPPSFAGTQLAYSTDTTKISLAWGEAIDDKTPSSNMIYYIYKDIYNDVNYVYNSGNLVTSVTGETEAEIDGLSVGTTYYFLVVAEDNAGNRNENHKLTSATTMSVTMDVERTPINTSKETYADDITVSDDNSTVIIQGNYGSSFATGDPILIETYSGMALKEVTSVSVSSGETNLDVEDTSLDKIIRSGELSNRVMLTDTESLPDTSKQTSLLPRVLRKKIATRKRAGFRTYAHPEGKFVMWQKHAKPSSRNMQTYDNSTSDSDTEYSGSAGISAGVYFDYGVSFEPYMQTDARWTERTMWPDRLDYVKVVTGGTFTLSGALIMELIAQADFEVQTEIFKKGIALTYAAGPVPVYQEVDLSFNAKLSFESFAKLSFETEMKFEKEIKLGIEWTRDADWDTIKEDGFTQEFTYELTDSAGFTLTLTIFPIISTTFYTAAEANFSILPTLGLNAELDLVPRMYFTIFDADFWVDAAIATKLSVFKQELASWESDPLTILSKNKLLSLPSVQFLSKPSSGDVSEPVLFVISVMDGVNNTVQTEDIEWEVDPSTASITPYSDKESAEFETDDEGNYEITASVSGENTSFLGSFGVQKATADVEIEKTVQETTTTTTIEETSTTTSIEDNSTTDDDVCNPSTASACGGEDQYCDSLDLSCQPCPSSKKNCDGINDCECSQNCDGYECGEAKNTWYIVYNGTEYLQDVYLGDACYKQRSAVRIWTCQDCSEAEADTLLATQKQECINYSVSSDTELCPASVEHHYYHTGIGCRRDISSCNNMTKTTIMTSAVYDPWLELSANCCPASDRSDCPYCEADYGCN